MIGHPAQQVLLLNFCSSLYIIAYGQIMPHHDKVVGYLELFNECMFMLYYHLYFFSSGYIVDETKTTQFAMRYSYQRCIACLVVFPSCTFGTLHPNDHRIQLLRSVLLQGHPILQGLEHSL
jgi:hypothetical protein